MQRSPFLVKLQTRGQDIYCKTAFCWRSTFVEHFQHGVIIGITSSKKIPCQMHHLACRWSILKMLKIFEVMLYHFKIFLKNVAYFWISARARNCRILIGLCKYIFMNQPILFLFLENKRTLVPASFSCFLEFYDKKLKFSLCDVFQPFSYFRVTYFLS